LVSVIEAIAMSNPGSDAVDFRSVFAALPTAYLLLSPSLVIVEANEAYLQLLGRTRAELVGRPVFEAFPPSPEVLDEHGRNPLQASFEKARDTGLPDRMQLFEYDVVDAETGRPAHRFWSLISAPVLDADGCTQLILQRVEDVTDYVVERAGHQAERDRGQQWQRRVETVEADLYARAQELRAAREAEAVATKRLAALADVALQLAQALTVEDLTGIVTDRGLAALGADGGALAILEADGMLQLSISAALGKRGEAAYRSLHLNEPSPGSLVARTGQRVLLPDAEAARQLPGMQAVLDDTGCQAWAGLPLRSQGRTLGSLLVGWSEPQKFTAAEIEVFEGLAAQCAHSLDRLLARQAERASAAADRRMSETLQRSLLTDPPRPDDLEIVVRYRPAVQEARVGGDWYDAFLTAHGTTCLVVGDVAGHDRDAAAAMGQLRNLLRGIAYTVQQPPAAVLEQLDRAIRDLDVGSLATGVLAMVHQDAEQAATGARLVRWSNAGHPPPLLIEASGSVRLLETDPDLLLGLDAATARTDHEVLFGPGATLLLYTDGLVERRGPSIQDGLDWFTDAVHDLAGQNLDTLCDRLLDQVDSRGHDDIALLALRVHHDAEPSTTDVLFGQPRPVRS
jgi:serine phosphatase RsbU (regulator of sigma subunit)